MERKKVQSFLQSILALLFVSAVAPVPGCSAGLNADKIARALADRLGDAMQFDNAEKHEGEEPPPPNNDPAQAPQVKKLQGDTVLYPGGRFEFKVKVAFSDISRVEGIVLQIKGSPIFYTISASFDGDGFMTVSGSVTSGESLDMIRRQSFDLMFAFYTRDPQTNDMIAGAYKKWNVVIPGKTDSEIAAGDVCARICKYLLKCGFINREEDSGNGMYYYPIDFDECMSLCGSSQQDIYRSNPVCVRSVNVYTNCMLNLSCAEFERVGETMDKGDYGPCTTYYYRMEGDCKDEEWWHMSYSDTGQGP